MRTLLAPLLAAAATWAAAEAPAPPPPPSGAPPVAAAAPPAVAPAADPAAEALRAAAAAWAQRGDPGRLDEAIARFREAASLRPGGPAELGLARALALRAESSPGAAREAWAEASRAAERALRPVAPAWATAIDRGDDPARAAAAVPAAGAEALYWLARAAMGMAEARGMAAVLAVKDAARAMMQRAAVLDERVDHGGPRRALGAWLATLPSAAGGGAAAASAELERARALAPAYQLTRVREAGVLAVLLQDRKRFDALLDGVLAFDDARAPDVAPENRLAKRLARELRARADRLF